MRAVGVPPMCLSYADSHWILGGDTLPTFLPLIQAPRLGHSYLTHLPVMML
jgi:hypothetical protein